MEKINIRGLNLHIDGAIHEICQVSNATSTNTRGVLYFVIVVNILSLIAVINTNEYNWIDSRVAKAQRDMWKHRKVMNEAKASLDSMQTYDSATRTQKRDYDRFPANKKNDSVYNHIDSIYLAASDKFNFSRHAYEARARSNVENYLIVRLPIFGYLFDINDLGIVSGITLIILLIILRFTIIREGTNLNVAMRSIKERYPPHANREQFDAFIKEHGGNDAVQEMRILIDINYVRRQHHYNFLSMNEIFNFPPVKSLMQRDKRSAINKFPKNANLIFLFPALVYLIILLNDMSTLQIGIEIDQLHATVNFFSSVVFFLIITLLCLLCIRKENEISKLYVTFYQDNFGYPPESYKGLLISRFKNTVKVEDGVPQSQNHP